MSVSSTLRASSTSSNLVEGRFVDLSKVACPYRLPDYRHHALIVLAGVSCVFAPLAADWLANWSKAKQVERQAQRLAGQQRRRQAATDAFLKHKYRLEKDMAQLFNEMQEEGATLDEITKRTKQLKQANNKSLTAELKLLADEEARSQSP